VSLGGMSTGENLQGDAVAGRRGRMARGPLGARRGISRPLIRRGLVSGGMSPNRITVTGIQVKSQEKATEEPAHKGSGSLVEQVGLA